MPNRSEAKQYTFQCLACNEFVADDTKSPAYVADVCETCSPTQKGK